jgi:hypothetical protein
MPIEEVTRFKASDGEEFGSRAAAEAHEAKLEAESALSGIDRAGLLADPLSPRSRAFEKLGGEIAAARRALPNGLLRHRKAKAEIDYCVTSYGCPAQTYGPPENCYPAEGPEAP